MSDRHLPLLDPDADMANIDRFLDAERSIPAAPDGARDRVRGRLAATLGVAGASALVATSSASRVGLAKLALTCLLGVIAGGSAVYLLMRDGVAPAPVPAPPPVVAVAPAVAAPIAPPPSVAPAEPVEEEPAIAPAAPAAVRPPRSRAPHAAPRAAATVPVEEPASSLAAERALLEAGRAALSMGDPAGALARVATHASRFPRGQLIEERETLRVRALVSAGRADEARAQGEAFRRRFPDSVYLPAIDATLQSIH